MVKRSSSTPDTWTFVICLGYAIAILLLVYPMFNIFKASFIDNVTGRFSLSNYQEILGTAYYRRAILNTLIVSSGGTIGALILGVPLAFLTARYRVSGRSIITILAVLSMVSPPFIGAYAWIMMFGRNGFLRKLFLIVGIDFPVIYGAFGIIVVFSLRLYPLVFLLTSSGLSTADRSLDEAAENLGAGVLTRFFKISLPMVIPSISAGALIVFMLSLSDFGTPMVIGRRFHVLAPMAYNYFTSEVGRNPGISTTLSIILVFFSSITLCAHMYISRRRNYASNLVKRPFIKTLTGWKAVGANLICYVVVSLSTLPLAVIVFSSFRETAGPVVQKAFSLQNYQRIIPDIPGAIVNSLFFSVAAVLLIVIGGTLIGFVISRRRNLATECLDFLLMTPYMVPGTVLGIGFIIAFNRKPFLLVGTGAIIVTAYFIRRLPYSIRSGAAILKQIQPSIEDAAVNLGAPPGRAFRKVTLPLMLPGIVAGAMMSFVMVINELSSSVILYVGKTITMPIKIYLAVIDADFGPGAALSTVLLVITGTAIYIIRKASNSEYEIF